jgi:hypothetical protein
MGLRPRLAIGVGEVPAPERGRVLVLDPLTLDVLGEYPLDGHASRLLPAPVGRGRAGARVSTT